MPSSPTLPAPQLEMFLTRAGALAHHLEMHHSIEEQYIFPILARRMPVFGKDHIAEHKAMHEALERYDAYCNACVRALKGPAGKKAAAAGAGKPDESEDAEDGARKAWPKEVYDLEKMKGLVEELGATLFPHLDHEEASLKADNMKKAGWSLEELSRIPM